MTVTFQLLTQGCLGWFPQSGTTVFYACAEGSHARITCNVNASFFWGKQPSAQLFPVLHIALTPSTPLSNFLLSFLVMCCDRAFSAHCLTGHYLLFLAPDSVHILLSLFLLPSILLPEVMKIIDLAFPPSLLFSLVAVVKDPDLFVHFWLFSGVGGIFHLFSGSWAEQSRALMQRTWMAASACSHWTNM